MDAGPNTVMSLQMVPPQVALCELVHAHLICYMANAVKYSFCLSSASVGRSEGPAFRDTDRVEQKGNSFIRRSGHPTNKPNQQKLMVKMIK